MGCSPSQSSVCILVEQRTTTLEQQTQANDEKDTLSLELAYRKEFASKDLEEVDSQSEGFLQESLRSQQSERSSKSSNSSGDSGVFELENEYSHVITENSAPGKVQNVDNEFIPKDNLELVLEGKACPMRLSAKDRDLIEQQRILETLRVEGLIVRPPSKAVGGLRFELVSESENQANQSSKIRKLPPLIARKKQKQGKVELTYEEIEQKLIEADERRKKRTEEKLSKMAGKDRQEIQAVVQNQTEINRLKIEQKIQATAKSREKHLIEVQEKLKAREEYAKKVRERKQMLAQGFKYALLSGKE